MRSKEELLQLIEREIRAFQLVYALEDEQLDLDLYLADHSTTIFESLNIESRYCTDELYSTYFSLLSKGQHIDLKKDTYTLKRLTLQVYNYLLKYGELCAILNDGFSAPAQGDSL